jgi:hypothetical protein
MQIRFVTKSRLQPVWLMFDLAMLAILIVAWTSWL